MPPSKQKISYSPESIKISFVLDENLFNSLQTAPKETSFLTGQENPACEAQGGAVCMPQNLSALPCRQAGFGRKTEREFVSLSNAPQKKFQRTPQESKLSTGQAFTFVLPNLVHKANTIFPKSASRRSNRKKV